MKKNIIFFSILLVVIITTSIIMASDFIGNEPVIESYAISNVRLDKGKDNFDSEQEKAKEIEFFKKQENVEANKVESLKIVAVGDILLGRGVGNRLESSGKTYKYPFEKVVDFLKVGDVVFGNLEESITNRTNSLTKIKFSGKYVLKNNSKAMEGIKYAGFNFLNLANNHILDYYEDGLFDTMKVLDENNIKYAGVGKNIDEARKLGIIEKKGSKIGMLSYTDMAEIVYKGSPQISFIATKEKTGVAPIKKEYIMEDVKKSKSKVDILIVSLHWGIEESFRISKEQISLAHDLIDQGVDIILGHHPHQFQGIEIYKGKPIIYSMGNFIFDQNDPENQESFIMNLEYLDNKISKLWGIPIRTIGKTQIVPQNEIGGNEMLLRQVKLSKELGANCEIKGNTIVYNLK